MLCRESLQISVYNVKTAIERAESPSITEKSLPRKKIKSEYLTEERKMEVRDTLKIFCKKLL